MLNVTQNKLTALLVLALLLVPGLVMSDDSFRNEILERESDFKSKKVKSIGNTRIHADDYIFNLYKLNSYQPLWGQSNTKALIDAINNIDKDGLKPEDYLLAGKSGASQARTVSEQVDRDMLLTESFLRATYNLLVGKVDPESLDSDFNFSRSLEGGKHSQMLLDKIRQGEIEQAFDWARPAAPSYQRMKKALEKYRGIQASGGWQPISAGGTLKPGDQDPRVIMVKKRLMVSGDYENGGEITPLFDEKLADAVERFQTRYGLDTDRAVGKNTLAALNIPVAAKIDQIRVALERQRWYLHEARGEYMVVDIAGFKAYWVKDGKMIWEEDVQVGKKYTNTPVFKDNMRYIEFNPTWTIPPGIMRRTILPNLKKDPEYLNKKGYLLLKQDGTQVDPTSVDWASISRMPYIVRQPPGENNALGLVKFMFPNKHAVYLHDTNHRELFDRTQRTFSSGCVRVNNPFDLAERLLAGQDDWDRKKIDEVVASKKTTRVNLAKPLRIIIAYATVIADEDMVYFRKDVYARDPAVLKGLNGKFSIRKQDK